MLREYSISDIITSNPIGKTYYVGTFEETDNPKVDWPHRHSYYSLVWFTKGNGTNVIDFSEYTIKPNRLFLMRPKQVHNWSYSKGTEGYIIVLDSHFEKTLPVELRNIVYFDFDTDRANSLIPLFDNLILESKLNDRLSEKTVIAGVSYLFTQLTRLSAQFQNNKRLKPQVLVNFSELITNTISQNIAVTEYADKLKIPIKKLNELCKEYYGQSPKAFVLDMKITESKRLLYFTTLTVSQIAFNTGFEDSSYFSRIFKEKIEMSPSQFRAKVPE